MLAAGMSCQGQSAVDINHHPLQYCERVVWLPQGLELLLTGLDDHGGSVAASRQAGSCKPMVELFCYDHHPGMVLSRAISTNCMRAWRSDAGFAVDPVADPAVNPVLRING